METVCKNIINDMIERVVFGGNVIHGDCIEGMKKLPDNSAQIIIADPPYNIGKDFGNNSDKQKMEDYLDWCDIWILECLRLLKPNGSMFIYGFSEILAQIMCRVPNTIHMRWLVWHYTNKTTPSAKFWQRSHESILVLWKDSNVFNRDLIREPYTESFTKGSAGRKRPGTPGRFGSGVETTYTAHPMGALPRDVIKIATLAGGGKERVAHPTQKPLELCERLINSCKQENGVVLVPFAGSGSECVASKKLGIPFIGYELNNDYIGIIKSRLDKTIVPVLITNKFSTEHWKHLECYKNISFNDTQLRYYQDNNASAEILQLVSLNSKKFGSACENIIKEILGISTRLNTQHDGILNGKKIEIKVGRYIQGKQDCMWQHIEPEHDFDELIVCLLTFTGIEMFTLSKDLTIELINSGIIKKQGKQGYIVKKSQVFKYLTSLI